MSCFLQERFSDRVLVVAVFSFNNEFSWVNNKAIVLTLGQWPSRQGMAPTALGRFEPEPEPEPRSGGAVGLLKSLRSGGGGGGATMSANPMMAAPPPIGAAGGGGPRTMVANSDEDDAEDESAPLAI